jgi:putative transposase
VASVRSLFAAEIKKRRVAGLKASRWHWLNTRAENCHLPFRQRERMVLRFMRMRPLHKSTAVHAPVLSHFNRKPSFFSRQIFKLNRTAALTDWRNLCVV